MNYSRNIFNDKFQITYGFEKDRFLELEKTNKVIINGTQQFAFYAVVPSI